MTMTILRVALISTAVGLLIPLMIWLTGGMFYQRCERMYPADAIKADRCAELLSRGMDEEARRQ